MIVRNALTANVVAIESRSKRYARRIGLSAAAAMLAGTALVPASAQIVDLGGGPVTTANFLNPAPFTGVLPAEVTNGQLTVDNAGNLTFGGSLTDSLGVFSLTKIGAGALTLTGGSNYSGGTTLTAGQITIGNNSALGNGVLTVSGNSTLGSNAGFNHFIGNAVSVNAATTLSVTSATNQVLSLNGVISGDGALRKTGASNTTVRLNGANTFIGGFQMSGGRVEVGNNAAFGTGTLSSVGAGVTTIAQADPATSRFIGNNVSLTTAALNIEAPNAGQTFTFGGNFTTSRAVNVLGSGLGTVVLSGVNSIQQTITVFGGWLGVGSASALGGNNRQLHFGTDAQGLAFYIDGATVNRRLLDSGVVKTAAIDTRGFNATLSGILNNSATGTLGLDKVGAGILTVSNSNALVGTRNELGGGFTVSAGTLNLSGRLHNDVVVNGGSFAGTGVVSSGTTTVNSGGNLSPGNALNGANAVGTLTLNNLTLAGGSSVLFNLGAPSLDTVTPLNDLVVVNGNLNLGGVLNVNPLGGFAVGTYRLFTYAGALAGTLGLGTLPGGFNYSFTNGGGFVDLNVVLPDFYWDGTGPFGNGTVNGGSGDWTPGGTNWTDSSGNSVVAWGNQLNFSRAIFQGTAGTVRLTETRLFEELRFLTDGYVINPEDSGEVLSGSSSIIDVADGVTATVNVAIDGGNGLTKTGNGTLNFGNANTIADGIFLNAGRINISNNEGLGFDGLTMAAGTTLGSYLGQVTAANNVTIAGGVTFSPDVSLRLNGIIGGSGGFTKTGAGELGLAGVNTFMGNVNVNTGTIRLLNTAALGNAANVLNLANATNLIVGADIANAITTATAAGIANDGSARTLSGVISGDGLITYTGAGSLTLSGINTYSGGSAISGTTIAVANNAAFGTGSVGVSGTSTLRVGTAAGQSYDVANNFVLNGAALTVDGLGSVTLPATFTGSRLRIDGSVTGTGSLTVNNGGLLVLAGNNGALSAAITVGGGAVANGAILAVVSSNGLGTGLLTVNRASLVENASGGTITINSNVVVNGDDFQYSAFGGVFGNDYVINGNVSGTDLNKFGANTLTLNGANNTHVQTLVDNGTVVIGTATALGSGTYVTTAADSGSTLRAGVDGLVVTNNFFQQRSFTADTQAFTLTLNGNLNSMAGGGINNRVTKAGSGTLILNGNNGFTGGLSANAGTVVVGSNTALGTGLASFSANTTLRSGAAVSLGNLISVAGGVTIDSVGANALALTNTISGSGGVTKTGNGQLSLSGNNSFTGGFNQNAGFIVVGSNTAFGDVGNLVTVDAAAEGFSLANALNVGNAFSLGGTARVEVGGADVATLSGNIGGAAGSINKTGTGTLILSGNSTYEGGTSVAGTLQLNNNNAAGSGAITLNGSTLAAGAALTLANAVVLNGGGTIATNQLASQFDGAIGGTGGLTVTNVGGAPFNGVATLTNAGNNFAGGLIISTNATVSVAADGALGALANAVTINEGRLQSTGTFTTARGITLGGTFGQIDVTGGQTLTADGLVGGSQLRKSGAGSLVLTNAASNYNGGTQVLGGALVLGGPNVLGAGVVQMFGATSLEAAADANINNNITLEAGSTATISSRGNVFRLDAPIGEAAAGLGFTKTGAGELVLNGVNTYTGATAVNAGIVTVGSNSALGTGAANFAANTTLRSGAAVTLGNLISVAGGVTIDSVGANALALTNTISGTGGVTKTGNGQLSLSGNNDFTGGFNQNAGFIVVGSNTAFGAVANLVTVNAAAEGFSLANALNVGNAFSLGGTARVEVGGANVATLSGNIGGAAGSINKTGTGTLILSGNSTYEGGTSVAGTLQLNNGNAAGTGAITLNGSTLAAGAGLTLANAVVLNGGGTIATNNQAVTLNGLVSGTGGLAVTTTAGAPFGATLVLGNAGNSFAGGLTIGANAVVSVATDGALGAAPTMGSPNAIGINDGLLVATGTFTTGRELQLGGTFGQIDVDGGQTLTANGRISGGQLRKGSTGTLVVGNGLNNFAGGTSIFGGGTLAVAASGVLGAGQIDLLAGTLASVGPGVVTLANNVSIGAAGNFITIADAANTLELNGAVSGSDNFTKTGAGTLRLNGVSSYSGIIQLTGGEIDLEGSIAGGINGATGTRVTGAGTASGATVIGDGGTLSPGNSPGTVVFGSLVLSNATNLVFDLDVINTVGMTNDLVIVNTDLTLDGLLQVQAGANFNIGVGSYRLFQYGNLLANGTVTLTNGALPLPAGYNLLTPPNGVTYDVTTTTGVGAGAGNVLFNVAYNGTYFFDGNGTPIDGIIQGGPGTWNGALTNFTNSDGLFNLAYADSFTQVVQFGGATAGGTVNVVGTRQFGTINFTDTGYTLSGAGDLAINNGTINVTGGIATVGVAINGSNGLTKIGAGNLALNAANGYTGGTSINAGTVTVGNNAALSTGLVTMANDTVLANNANDLVVGNAFSIGNVTVATGGNNFTLSGVVNGAGLLTKTGSGNLILNGGNGYTGGSAINAGTVTVGNNTALGTNTVTMANDTVLANNTDNLNVGNAFSIGNVEVATGANNFTLSGVVNGAGLLTKTGAGNLILTGANGYTGGSAINAGTVTVGNNTAFGTNTVTMANDTVLANNLNNLVVGNAFSIGNVTVATGSNFFTLAGVVNGAGLLTKTGAGNLILNGGNGYTGGTALTAGTITVGNNTALGTNTLTMTGGTSLVAGVDALSVGNAITTLGVGTVDTAAFTFTLGGVIDGAGSISKIGNGNLVLNGASTYTGGSSITAGTVTAGNNTAFGTNTVTMADNTVLANNANNLVVGNAFSIGNVTVATGGNNFTLSGVVNGAGLLTKTGAGNLILNGGNGYTGGTALTAGSITVGNNTALGTNTLTMTGGTSLVAGVDALSVGNAITTLGVGTVDTAAFTLTLGGVIDGAGSITKIGSGNLVLNGANSYTGGSNINVGTVTAGNNTAFGTNTVTMANDTVLANNTNNLVIGNAFSIGNVEVATGANTFTLSGVVNGAGLLTKTGSGNLILNGANGYTGGTALTAGTITVGTNTALGTNTLTMTGGTSLVAGVDALSVGNAITTLGVGTVDTAAFTLTLNGLISGAGSITKIGSGNLVLNNANSYTGGSSIEAGTVTVGNNAALGTNLVTMLDGTTLANNTNNLVVANNFTIGNATVATGANSFTMTGAINGTGALTKTGAGTLVLTGTNTYGSGTFLTAGTLQIDDGNAIGSGTLTTTAGTTLIAGLAINTPTLTLANNIVLGAGGNTTINLLGSNYGVNVTTGALTTNGTPLVLNGVISGDGGIDTLGFLANGGGSIAFNNTNSFTGGVNLGSVIAYIGANNALGTGTVNLNAFGAGIQNTAVGTTYSLVNNINVNASQNSIGGAGNLVMSGLIGGNSDLFKVNDGTVTFTGVGSTYGGNFAINDGTVLVNGSFVNAAANYVVAGGARIGGTGTIAGTVSLANGADLNPGTSPGTLTVGNLNLAGLTNVNFELGAANTLGGLLNDRVIVTGNLVLDGLLNVTESVGGSFGLGIYNLFSYGTLTDNGLILNGVLPGALTGSIQHNVAAQQINLVVAGPDSVTLNWDGTDFTGQAPGAPLGQGGTGVWNTTNTNWTGQAPGEINATWQPNAVGIFGGTAGTVDVASAFTFGGLGFQTTGYLLNGAGSLTTNATLGSFISVDPALTATINTTIAGTGALLKQGAGTLVLGGTNTNSGGVNLTNGTLAVTNNAALGTGALTFTGGTTLRADAGVTLANNMVLNGTSNVDTNGNTVRLNGVLSGGGLLDKDGAGSLILAGTNSYSGGTNLNAGTLTIGNSAAIGTGTLTTAGGTTVFAGLTAGGGSVITLGNAVELNGATTLNLQGTSFNLTPAGVLTFDGTTLTLGGNVNGSGPLTVTGIGRVNLNGNNGYTGGTSLVGAVAFVGTNTAFGTGAVSLAQAAIGNDSGALRTLTNTITLDGDASIIGPNDITLAGTISGAGQLSKLTASTLTLNGANTYTGATNLFGGTIVVGTSTAIGTNTLFVENNGQATSLRAGAADLTLANAVFLQATSNLVVDSQAFTFGLSGVINGAGALTKVGSGNLILNGANGYAGGTALTAGTITVGNNTALGTNTLTATGGTSLVAGANGLNLANAATLLAGNLTVDSGTGTFQLSGVVGGAGGITKVNSGNLILSGNNSYAGGTGLTAGTITVNTSTALGGGTLTATGGTSLVAGVSGLNLANATTLLAGNLTVNSGTGMFQLSGVIGGVGGITKVNSGNLILTGANGYTGGSSINAGTVTVGNNTAFGTNTVTMADNTVLANNANNLVVGNAFSIGNVTVATGANNFTLSGVVNGAGLLTKTGSGNLILNGANGYTGGTALTAGTITVGNNTALGTNTLTMTGGTSLVAGVDALSVGNAITTLGVGTVDTAAFTLTLGGVIDGAGSITKIGSGNLVLNGANSYTGGSSINAGTVTAGNNTAFGTNTVTMANDTVLANNANNLVVGNAFSIGNVTVATGANTFTMNGVVNGAGLLTKTGSGNLILNGANGYTGGSAITAGTVTVGNNAALGTNTVTMANNTVLANNANNLNVANAFSIGNVEVATGANTFTMSGVVNGAGLLTKTGSGNLILTGNNGYTGGSSITAGTVTVGNNNALGTGLVTMANSTVLANNANNLVVGNAFSIGNVEVATGGNTFTLAGVVNGAGLLTKTGSGTLILNGANGFTGGVNHTAGDVVIGSNTALGTGTFTYNGQGTRVVSGVDNLQVANNFVLNNNNTLNNPFDTQAFTTTLSGTISGAGAFAKFGTGTLILTGNNSYAGGTDVLFGRVSVGTNTAVGSGNLNLRAGTTLQAFANNLTLANTISTNAGVETIDTQAFNFTLNGVVSGDGTISKIGSGTLVLKGANSYTGGTALTAGTIQVGSNTALGTGRLTMTGGTTLLSGAADLVLANNITTLGVGTIDTQAFTFTLNGVIDGAGSITKNGTGNLILNGANTYAGGSNLNAGTVTLGNNSALGSGPVNINGAVTLLSGINNLSIANNVVLNSAVNIDTAAFTTSYTGVISGPGGIIKLGSGNLVLAGVNTYQGGTDLNAGSLTVTNNSSIGTGQLTTTGGTTLIVGTAVGVNTAVTLANAVSLGAGTTAINLQGTLMGPPAYTLNNNGSVVVNGAALTLNGVVSGAGALSTNNFGTLTLNGNNSYAGGTLINDRTVVYIGSDTAVGTGTVTMGVATALYNNSGATRTLANNFLLNGGSWLGGANDLVLNGAITGAGTLIKAGPDTLVLNGNNSGFTGNSQLRDGRITVNTSTALGTGGTLRVFITGAAPLGASTTLAAGTTGLALANNVSLDIGSNLVVESGTGVFTLGGVISGAGALTKIQSGTLVLNGANTFTGGTSLNMGTIQVGTNTALGTNTLVMAGGTTLQAGVAGLALANAITTNGIGTIDTQAFTFTLNGVIGGAGSITKIGSGNLVLNAANTYTGGSNITAGTVTVGNNTAFGTNLVTMANGTVLANNANNLNVANAFSIGNVEVATGANTFTMSGTVNGAGLLTKTGAGNLILTGNNGYTGGTALTAGTITFNTNTAFGTGTVTTTGGTSLVAGVNDPSANQVLTVANNVALGAGTTNLDLQGTSFSAPNAGGVDVNGTTLTLGGVISGAGALNVFDNGRLTLNGANSYAGGTTVSSAAVYVGTDTAFGTGTVTSNFMVLGNDSGALRTLANAFTLNDLMVVTGPNNITLNGVIGGASGLVKTSTSTLTLNAANSFGGSTSLVGGRITVGNNLALSAGQLTVFNDVNPTTLTAGVDGLALANNAVLSTGSNLIVESGAGNFTLNGVISGGGALTKIQTGRLILNGANTFSGGTALNVGTIQVGTNTALGTAGLVMADATTLQAGVDALTLANNITTNGVGIVDTQAFTFTLGGVIDGAGSINKIGSGTLVLNGNNSYAGGTDLDAGTIVVNTNTALGTGTLAMSNGTTLVSGTDGLVVANDVTLEGTGTVDTGAFTFTLSGTLRDVLGAGGFVGQWQVDQGPQWNGSPPNGPLAYTGQEAAALLFGGVAGNYAISTAGVNPALINNQAWYSIIGFGAEQLAEDYFNKFNGQFYGPTVGFPTGSSDAPASAYVNDNATGAAFTNYAFSLGGPGIAGELVKVGTGRLILQGANSYSGGTRLTAGSIQVENNLALGTGQLTMTGGTTLLAGVDGLTVANGVTTLGVGTVDTGANTLTLTGIIGGAGSITKTGAGNLILQGLNTYVAGTLLEAGTITVATDSAIGTGTLTMLGGTTLNTAVNVGRGVNTENVVIGNAITGAGIANFNADTGLALILTGPISGLGQWNKTGGGLLVLNGNNSFSGGFALNGGTLRTGINSALGTGGLVTADGTTLQNGVAGVTLANAIGVGGALTIDTQEFAYTLNGVISGSGPITKIGSANLTLNGANSYTGGTALTAGSITVGANTALGTGGLTMTGGTSLISGANNLTVANNIATLGIGTVNTNANTMTLSGVISGVGSIAKIGSGTLVLNGLNSYAGGTALNAGTITVSTNSALGTGTLAMAAGTTLNSAVNVASGSNTQNVVVGNAITLAGVGTVNTNTGLTLISTGAISGAGSLTKTGGGLLVLNGTNSYTGGTAFNAGTIRVGNNAAFGTGTVTAAAGTILQAGVTGVSLANNFVLANGFTVDNFANQLTLGGVISGAGPLSVIDSTGGAAGVLTLSGTNSYTGGTVATGTAVRVSADVNLGNTAGNVTLNRGTLWTTASFASARTIALGTGGGTIQVAPSTAFTVNGTIAGTALTKTGGGELVLNTLNSYLSGTTFSAGTITVANNLALSIGAVAMADGTTLNTATNRGTTTNTQNVTLANNISTAGVATVNANTGLTLILDGFVTGAGSINKTGGGLLVLNNQNSFTGGTTLAGGTIRTGNGSALGTGRLTTTGGTTLQAGNAGLTVANAITLGTGITTVDSQAFTYTLSGVASGAGGLTKVGSGVLNLTAASTYTGATTVATGTLNVTGSLVSGVTVNSGAALTGTGTIGSLNVLAGGSVAPGAPATTNTATITVTGAATLAGTYTVDATPAANDRITAGGALTLGGTLAFVPVVPSSFSQFNQTLTVASGATRTGTFATVSGLDQFGIAFAPVVEYTTTAANVRLAPQSLAVLGARFGGISGNQLEVANAFDRAVATGYNPQAFFNVYANGGTALPQTLRQMSGEQRATERRVVLDTNRVFREAALDRLNGGLASLGGQQVSSSDGDRTLTFWLRGAGSWGKGQTSGAATTFTTEQRGVITGLDWAKGGLTVGGMFHYTSTNVEYRVLGGSSNVETVGGTAYAGYRQDGGVVVNGGVSVAGARTNGSRAISLPSFAQSLAGTTNGTTYQFFGELAWDLAASADTRIEPFARLTYVKADLGALAETGGVAALAAAKQGYDITVTNLGARFGGNVAGGKVALSAGASWQNTGGDRDAATIIGIPAVGQNGLIRSVQMDRDSLALQADAGVNLSNTIRFSLGYSGLIGKRNDDHGGRATLNFAF